MTARAKPAVDGVVGIPHATLAEIGRKLDEILAAWSPEIVRRRGRPRLLRAAVEQAQHIARGYLGTVLTREQKHAIAVLADGRLAQWEARALRG